MFFMSMVFASLGSGSGGNCGLITNGRNHFLIDAGLNPLMTEKKLRELGFSIADLDGILLTHEHDDHVRGIVPFADILPVYSHQDTLCAVAERFGLPLRRQVPIEEEGFFLESMSISPFRVSHDAAHPFGFVVDDGEEKFTYMTDTGYVSKGALSLMRGSKVVVLESNHDREMLLCGRYPQFLKRRIVSERGHLSNEECALAVADLVAAGAEEIFLAHLSEKNNLPELAYWTTAEYLKRMGADGGYRIMVTSQQATVTADCVYSGRAVRAAAE